MYHIDKWSKYDDKILSNLCSMFLNRDNFKIINLKNQKVDIEKIKQKVVLKYDLEYYFSQVKIPIKIMENEIYVQYNTELKPLSEVSDLIQFYKSRNWNVEYLIFPKDIEY